VSADAGEPTAWYNPGMTDRAALIAAVLANPDDDLPRLIFADWLDEHGEPDRGEFIRVQVELSKWQAEHPDCFDEPLPACSRCRRILALRSRERELFRGEWDEELGAFASTENPATVWRRGFVASVALPAADAVAHLDAVLAAHPVTAVTLTTRPEVEYTASAYMMRLVGDGRWFTVGQTAATIRSLPPAPDFDASAYWHRDEHALLRCRWPTVRSWHLPPEPAYREFDRVTVTRAANGDILLDGLPPGTASVDAYDPTTGAVVVRYEEP
jgi:uncharacterized protein (TIGR02996 family)